MNLSELRLSYTRAGLIENEVDRDPIRQFGLWLQQAIEMQLLEPNAMALVTTDASGQPNARMVLLKAFDAGGFVFYTNYQSRKAREIQENARVCLLFYWGELERQVRIAGVVGQVPASESDEYFNSRPIGHQLGAWVSEQSSIIESREVLEERLSAVAKQFEPGPVPRPPQWGGYRVRPNTIEFWQGRENRLHDRLEYVRSGESWSIRRLAP